MVLLAGVIVVRAFFPGATEVMRATVLPMIEEDTVDYRSAVTAIGETLSGDVGFLEAIGDITRAFGGMQTEDAVEVTTSPDEPEVREPRPTPTLVPALILPPIEEVFPVPEVPLEIGLLLLRPYSEEPIIPETPVAVAVFLAHQEPFSYYALPWNAAISYEPLHFEFVAPVLGPVSSPFGFRYDPILGGVRFHFGTDIALYTGTPFYAFADGRVVYARECISFGKYILLYHGHGVYTRYAHASALYVQAGDYVEMGQFIGRVGSTGGSTGPHLHFELRVNGVYRNAEFYVSFG